MRYVSGTIFEYKDNKISFKQGYLGFEEGIIKERGKNCKQKITAKGIIIPTFFNAHTHIGDSVVRDIPNGNIEQLVGPRGYKFKVLSSSKEKEIVSAMRSTIEQMILTGSSNFCDFREQGIKGIRMLKKALQNINCTILGRTEKNKFKKEEVAKILNESDGIAISSLTDWNYSELQKVAKETNAKNKIFALHCSERIREDINKVLELKPKFLVHLNKATDKDLEIIAENKIPIVVCPRSNVFFGMIPNIARLIEKRISVSLGTDNAMLNSPSMLREMEFAYKISKLKNGISAEEILKMAIVNPREMLNKQKDIQLIEGAKAKFIVLSVPYNKPEHAILKANSTNITLFG